MLALPADNLAWFILDAVVRTELYSIQSHLWLLIDNLGVGLCSFLSLPRGDVQQRKPSQHCEHAGEQQHSL